MINHSLIGFLHILCTYVSSAGLFIFNNIERYWIFISCASLVRYRCVITRIDKHDQYNSVIDAPTCLFLSDNILQINDSISVTTEIISNLDLIRITMLIVLEKFIMRLNFLFIFSWLSYYSFTWEVGAEFLKVNLSHLSCPSIIFLCSGVYLKSFIHVKHFVWFLLQNLPRDALPDGSPIREKLATFKRPRKFKTSENDFSHGSFFLRIGGISKCRVQNIKIEFKIMDLKSIIAIANI